MLIVIVAAYNAEENSYGPSGPEPGRNTGPRPPVAEVTLSGNWRDAEGGNYRLVQQGVQVAFQGLSPHGPVAGSGILNGNQLTLDYTLNGYPYQAAPLASPDGLNLIGQYRGASAGDSGPVHLQRAR